MAGFIFSICIVALFSGLAFEAGSGYGAREHYKGNVVCETLKNSSIHCYSATDVKSTTK